MLKISIFISAFFITVAEAFGVSVAVTKIIDPIHHANLAKTATESTATALRTAQMVSQSNTMLTYMGNPIVASALVQASLKYAGPQLSSKLQFRANDFIGGGINFNGESFSINLDGVRTDKVFDALGIEGVAEIAGHPIVRDIAAYTETIARQNMYSAAEVKLKENREAMAEVASKLQDARAKLAGSKDEATQRVLEAEIASLQAVQDQLVANEQAIVASRDSSLAMMANAQRIRRIAADEEQAIKGRSFELDRQDFRRDNQFDAIKNSLNEVQKPAKSNDWSSVIKPVWSMNQ